MLMSVKTIVTFTLLFLIGCVVDDVAIDVIRDDGSVEFAFHTGMWRTSVHLIDIRVTSSIGNIVWDLSTYDRSDFTLSYSKLYEKRGNNFVLKGPEDIPELNAQIVSRLRFGQIPAGFTQYYPQEGMVPSLETNEQYEIFAVGVGHRGRAKFTIQ
jgi:hypothetical protein